MPAGRRQLERSRLPVAGVPRSPRRPRLGLRRLLVLLLLLLRQLGLLVLLLLLLRRRLGLLLLLLLLWRRLAVLRLRPLRSHGQPATPPSSGGGLLVALPPREVRVHPSQQFLGRQVNVRPREPLGARFESPHPRAQRRLGRRVLGGGPLAPGRGGGVHPLVLRRHKARLARRGSCGRGVPQPVLLMELLGDAMDSVELLLVLRLVPREEAQVTIRRPHLPLELGSCVPRRGRLQR